MRTEHEAWRFVVCDGLARVHPSTPPRALAAGTSLQGFLGEPVSFQLAYLPPAEPPAVDGSLIVTVEGDAADLVTAWQVDLVPCSLMARENHDDGYEWDQPGNYPDVLRPPSGPRSGPAPVVHAPVTPGAWSSLWFDVQTSDPSRAGVHTLTVVATGSDDAELFRADVVVEITGVELPPLDIVTTNWMHLDALSSHYQVPVFSEEHWELVDRFMASAAQMGVNSLLTPVWTPPLDTAVGTYREVVQLVDIDELEDGAYAFGFEHLHRWLDLCLKNGITGIEIAHLFSQWGAEFTPQIVVRRGGEPVRAFGWDVPATDPRYRDLMAALLPALHQVLDERWDRRKVVFHISDEPSGPQLEQYLAAKNLVADLLDGWTIVDALSEYPFYEAGAVPIPVVSTDHAGPFLARRPEQLWVYYCINQSRKVSNRFIAMPSARNRAIGHQLFTSGVDGFLHWGYNFWFNHLSRGAANPFRDACGNGEYLAGDPFIVYPGDDGRPWPSIRYRVFAQAMWDHRALQAVRDLRGRDAALAIVDPDGTLTFDRPVLDPEHYYRVRRQLAEALAGPR